MITYYDLSPDIRALLIGVLFVELCGSLLVLTLLRKRKGIVPKLLLMLSSVATLSLTLLYATDMKSTLKDFEKLPLSSLVCEQPAIYTAALVVLVFVVLFVIGLRERAYQKNTITSASIRESLDILSSGLCFSFPNGRTVLVNNRMDELCHTITDSALQDANRFWLALETNDVRTDVQCISTGDKPCYLLPDGAVWSFSRKHLEGFVQITASDITQLYEVNQELEVKNKELKALNMRLRDYGENIVELTRSRERLETKTRIHGELGQALLATRRYLQGASNESPVKIWEKNISVLRMESILPEEDSYKMFLDAAKSIGVEIKMTGELPKNSEIRNLFMSSAAEALVNGVRHGNATTIFIDVSETDGFYKICFRNNGQQPVLPIKEGGGLGSLRKKVERLCGEMSVLTKPEFLLVIEVNKKQI